MDGLVLDGRYGALRESVRDFFRSPRARDAMLLVLLASAAFQLVLDFRIVRPTAIDWIFASDSDTAQYYLALSYFRFSAWHLPLTDMETLLHPVGASFTLTDAIPLLGIPTKALSPLLPVDFQYYGAWLYSCLLLNAYFGHLLLRRLVESPALRWAGTAIITLAPPLVARFGHCALSAQWLILAAFHSVMERRALPKRRIWGLSVTALFVHPYLFTMVSGLLAGAFFMHRRAPKRELLVGALGWALVIALSGWLLGYFGLHETIGFQADRYHADVTAFVSAMGTSSIVPDTPMSADFRRVWDGNAEGFAYLGLGGLLLLGALVARLVVMPFGRGPKKQFHPAFGVLGGLALLLALYAMTPSPVILGKRYSGILPLTELLEPLTARLRSTGRFIWPLFYFVLLFGLQAAEQWLSLLRVARTTVAGAMLLVCAQFADMGRWLVEHGRATALTNPPPLRPVPAELRDGLTARTRFLVFDPPPERQGCPGRKAGERRQPRWQHEEYYHLAVFGAQHQLIVNTDFQASARISKEELAAVCDFGRAVHEGGPRPDVLLVTRPE